MTIDKQEIKALVLACEPARCADEADESRRLAEFYSELTPETALALLAEIERLERDTKNDAIAYKAAIERQEEIRRERDQLKAENEALRSALGDCADELAAEIICKNGGLKPEDMHPVTRRLYERDMEAVLAARAAMAKEASHG